MTRYKSIAIAMSTLECTRKLKFEIVRYRHKSEKNMIFKDF